MTQLAQNGQYGAMEGGFKSANPDSERLHRQASRLAAEWIVLPIGGFWSELLRRQEAQDIQGADYSTHQADLEALRLLVARQDDWQLRYRAALEAAALAWRSRQQPKAKSNALTLMSELELSAELYGQQAIVSLEKALGGLQEAAERRVAAFAAGLGLRSDAGNPWGVDAVVRAFVETLPLDDFSPTLTPVVFEHLAQRLGPVLGDVLPRLMQLLAGAGDELGPVEPILRRGDGGGVAGAAAGGRVGANAGAGEWLPDGGLVEARHPISAAAPAGVVTGGPAGAPMPAGTAPGATHTAAGHAQPLRYRDVIHDRLSEWRQRAQQDGSWMQPEVSGSGHVFVTSEVMTVASMLQGEDPAPYVEVLNGQRNGSLHEVIREEMLKAAAQLGFDPDRTRFARDEQDAIDLVAMLFRNIADSNDLMSRGNQMFGKLVLPYVKVAMLDDSLFNRRAHPARRLLDALTETCDGNAGENAIGREMLDRADRVVDEVVSRFQEDQAIFELAAQELRDFLDQQRQRAELAEKRAAEALHGRERLHYARQAAFDALAERVADMPLAEASFAFMEGAWQKALVQIWLRHGADSARYRSLLELGDALPLLDVDGAALRSHSLAQGFGARLDDMRECLGQTGLIGEAADQAIARLLRGIADADGDRAIHPLQAPEGDVLSDAETGLHTVPGADDAPVDETLVARLRKLRIGQGLRIREPDGRESAARIAWVSPLTSRFLIVNRRGVRKLVVSPEQLAALVGKGEVTVRAVDAPVDHAMRNLWARLQTGDEPA
ncbi:MAG: DUF1631 family protein [Pseudomonadota bacterium]|nr:DUF1631 family protein [Pseudomonadota bacterium]